MTARAAMHRADAEVSRLRLIILEKDKIIEQLRAQLVREQEGNKALFDDGYNYAVELLGRAGKIIE